MKQRWTVTVAGLLALALVVANLHTLIVPHERCAEHGEMVERARPVGNSTGRRETVAAGVGPAESSAEHENHDHCLLCSLRTSDGPRNSAYVLAAALRDRVPDACDFRRPHVAIPVVLMAPKGSPPFLLG